MEVEPFLVSSSVIAVVAQRLVRRVCRRCAEQYVPPDSVLKRFGAAPGTRFRHGVGCAACNEQGYRGRIAIFELLPLSLTLRQMVMEGRSAAEAREQSIKEGMVTLREDGAAKARAGITSPEEVLRVTQDSEV
jgi:type II secretory ATPase GspE/PulE/Tfp pilus assembly ATPase PilB-like protein